MAEKRAGRSRRQPETLAGSTLGKVTLRLSPLTAQRLAIEAIMTGQSQSDIAERVLGAHLASWRLPSKVGGTGSPTDPAGSPAGVQDGSSESARRA